jgi:thiamine biosynthesis lipoprotein
MNESRRKNLIYSLILLVAVVGVWLWRNQKAAQSSIISFKGSTMGTYYEVTYGDTQQRNLQPQVDSLLQAFNQSLSTYIPTSEISEFNQETLLKYRSPFFYPVLERSRQIYEATYHAFDPTVGPLVNAWGFGPDGEVSAPNSSLLDSLRRLVNFDSIYFDSLAVCKMLPGMKLDFSAIAKGYGVDVVADYLHQKGIDEVYVNIGGEVRAYGQHPTGRPWRTGINKPSEDPEIQQQAQAVLEFTDGAVATSGNYRNYYERNGKLYSHTISPFTGQPVRHSLLSATVLAPDCMTADAYATAFMVLGLDSARQILEKEPQLSAYLIYSNEQGEFTAWVSPKLEGKLVSLIEE